MKRWPTSARAAQDRDLGQMLQRALHSAVHEEAPQQKQRRNIEAVVIPKNDGPGRKFHERY